jgi:hypothetical protein
MNYHDEYFFFRCTDCVFLWCVFFFGKHLLKFLYNLVNLLNNKNLATWCKDDLILGKKILNNDHVF